MDRSIAYAEVYSNFGSAYNALPQAIYTPPTRSGNYPSFLFNGNRPSSPLFHRSSSPPPAQITIPTGRGPKFNFDLYKMDGSNDDLYLPSPRPISPTTQLVIHHRPIYSTLEPTNEPAALTKLREINDDMYHTLARSDSLDPVVPARVEPVRPHYHIHHYPASQHPHQTYRTRSPPEYFSPSVTRETSPKVNKARVTYKIRIPQRYLPQSPRRVADDHEQIYISDESSPNNSIVVDMYPTRDHAVQTRRDKHEQNSNPWVVSGRRIRPDADDSDENTNRRSKENRQFYYADKPIKSHRSSTHRQDRQPSGVRHRTPFVASQYRPDSAPAYESDPYRDPVRNFVHDEASERRPKTSREKPKPKPSKPIDDKHRNRHILAFDSQDEPTPRPIYEKRGTKHSPSATESESGTYRRTNIRTNDPKLKERVAHAESKVKTAWEPTVIGLTSNSKKKKTPDQSIVVEPTTPIVKENSSVVEPPASTSNGQLSISDIPKQPAIEFTPKDQSQTSETRRSEKTATPPAPPSHNTTIEEPTNKTEQVETPKSDIPKTNDHLRSPITNEVNNQNERRDNESPPPTPSPPPASPPPKRKSPTPPPAPAVEDDEADQEVASTFDFRKWLEEAAKDIQGPEADDHTTPPASGTTPVQPAPPAKVTQKTTPRRKPQPPSPAPSDPDRDLYKPPFGPKKENPETKVDPAPLPTEPITTSAVENGDDDSDAADGFFE